MAHTTLTVEQELLIKDFRVSIFGSARTQPDDEYYQATYDLSHRLAGQDIDVVSGGGPGIMLAANQGHQAGNVSKKSHSIGLTIELPWEPEKNNHIDIHKHCEHFSNRLDTFMRLSNVVVVMPGGIGTALELFYTWQLVQVRHICHTPIILVGEMWHNLYEWVKKDVIGGGKASPEDLDNVFPVKNIDEAYEIIMDMKSLYDEYGNRICTNFEKYK